MEHSFEEFRRKKRLSADNDHIGGRNIRCISIDTGRIPLNVNFIPPIKRTIKSAHNAAAAFNLAIDVKECKQFPDGYIYRCSGHLRGNNIVHSAAQISDPQ